AVSRPTTSTPLTSVRFSRYVPGSTMIVSVSSSFSRAASIAAPIVPWSSGTISISARAAASPTAASGSADATSERMARRAPVLVMRRSEQDPRQRRRERQGSDDLLEQSARPLGDRAVVAGERQRFARHLLRLAAVAVGRFDLGELDPEQRVVRI